MKKINVDYREIVGKKGLLEFYCKGGELDQDPICETESV